MDETELRQIAGEVMDEYDQPAQFKDRFMTFYMNTVENNIGETSLKRLINNVELPEEDKIDES
ncbi:CxC ATPase DNA modification system associated small protein [Halapricum salinum]|uniref:Uncharacterized protein n=1 Tax=Halapricum salinum TaxID=1457250 RepID=A0A4D6HEG7_9EURY|nr:CxC ATPase DNA modification system associated small protein [Halapricum salinum]QCC51442.1 hypothetical protein DV733_09390 [Halapricum salinum]